MTTNEIEFLEYLDKAVEWEKEKQIALKSATPPFDEQQMLDIVEDFQLSKLKTMDDCVERMKMLKVLNNANDRRLFLTIVRENFNNIDFALLGTNTTYLKIKNEILSQYPELNFVDDSRFLRQIGNALAHGNYDSLLDMKKLDKVWTGSNKNPISFSKRNDSNNYTEYNFDLMLGKNKFSSFQKSSNLDFTLNLLYNTVNSETNIETLKFKYESSRMLDANGNVVARPSPKIFNLEVNHKQLKNLISLVISQNRLITNNEVQLSIETNNANKAAPKTVVLPQNATDEYVANYLLTINDYYLMDNKNQAKQKLNFDDKQKLIFVNDYISSRKWFGEEYFKMIENPLRDFIATNQLSNLTQLDDFFCHHCQTSAAAMTSTAINSSFAIANQKLLNFNGDIIDTFSQIISFLMQTFSSYSECLITETMILLQIIEDNSLASKCESSQSLQKIIDCFNKTEMAKIQAQPKYKNDINSVLKHLRDSFSHILYLNNLNNELFIYDYISNTDKTPDFKFTISIDNLQKIKSELLTIVKTHILQQNNAISQPQSNNSTTQNAEETLEL